MSKRALVKGHFGLEKDLESGALINVDKTSIMKAVERKKIRNMKKLEEQKIISDVSNLKEDMKEMKELMKKVLEKL